VVSSTNLIPAHPRSLGIEPSKAFVVVVCINTTQFLLDEDTFVDKIGHQRWLNIAQKLADILETVDSFHCLLTPTNVAG